METLIVQPKDKEQLAALKAKEQPYNPEFVTKMARAEDDINAGRITKIDPAKIWDYNN